MRVKIIIIITLLPVRLTYVRVCVWEPIKKYKNVRVLTTTTITIIIQHYKITESEQENDTRRERKRVHKKKMFFF